MMTPERLEELVNELDRQVADGSGSEAEYASNLAEVIGVLQDSIEAAKANLASQAQRALSQADGDPGAPTA